MNTEITAILRLVILLIFLFLPPLLPLLLLLRAALRQMDVEGGGERHLAPSRKGEAGLLAVVDLEIRVESAARRYQVGALLLAETVIAQVGNLVLVRFALASNTLLTRVGRPVLLVREARAPTGNGKAETDEGEGEDHGQAGDDEGEDGVAGVVGEGNAAPFPGRRKAKGNGLVSDLVEEGSVCFRSKGEERAAYKVHPKRRR